MFDSRRLRKLFFSSCLMLETFTKKVIIGCQLELETVSSEGCAPEIPVVSRRESMMIELTKKHIFCWL